LQKCFFQSSKFAPYRRMHRAFIQKMGASTVLKTANTPIFIAAYYCIAIF